MPILHELLRQGKINQFIGTLEQASPTECNEYDNNGKTLISIVLTNNFDRDTQLSLLDVLIRQGADVNKANADKETPLFKATFNGSLPVISKLLEAGADITEPSIVQTEINLLDILPKIVVKKISTRLIDAARDMSIIPVDIIPSSVLERYIAKLIQHGFDITISRTIKINFLELLPHIKEEQFIEKLQDAGIQINSSEKIYLEKFLISIEIDDVLNPNIEIEKHMTALLQTKTDLTKPYFQNIGRTLYIVKIEEQPHFTYTKRYPLLHAIDDDRGDIINIFVKQAELLTQANESKAKSLKSDAEAIEGMAKLSPGDKTKSLKWQAISLRNKAESLNITNKLRRQLDTLDGNNESPLHRAIKANPSRRKHRLETIKRLLELGVKVNTYSRYTTTPLHSTMECFNFIYDNLKDNRDAQIGAVKIIHWLVQVPGIKLDEVNSHLQTPLHLAFQLRRLGFPDANMNLIEITKTLVEAGACLIPSMEAHKLNQAGCSLDVSAGNLILKDRYNKTPEDYFNEFIKSNESQRQTKGPHNDPEEFERLKRIVADRRYKNILGITLAPMAPAPVGKSKPTTSHLLGTAAVLKDADDQQLQAAIAASIARRDPPAVRVAPPSSPTALAVATAPVQQPASNMTEEQAIQFAILASLKPSHP